MPLISALIALCSAIASADRMPCFSELAAAACFPPSVLGPVDCCHGAHLLIATAVDDCPGLIRGPVSSDFQQKKASDRSRLAALRHPVTVAPFPFTTAPDPVPRHPVMGLTRCDCDLLDDNRRHRAHGALVPMPCLPDPLVVLPCPVALYPSVTRTRLCRTYFLNRGWRMANDGWRRCLANDNGFPDNGGAATGNDHGNAKC